MSVITRFKVKVVLGYNSRDMVFGCAHCIAVIYSGPGSPTSGERDSDAEDPWIHFVFAKKTSADAFAEAARMRGYDVEGPRDFDNYPSINVLGEPVEMLRSLNVEQIH